MELLSDSVINPTFNEDEIQDQIDTANFELENMISKPDILIREVK